MSVTVYLGHDHDVESPADYDGWSPYSFSTKHINFKDPDEVDPIEDEELRAKLDNGLAFFLSYYEHGRCLWSLRGEGPQCRWDSVNVAGILIWEQDEDNIGAKTVEDRRKDAQRFLDSWNAYVNGDAWYFSIVNDCETCGSSDKSVVEESMGGFLGEANLDYMFSEIRSYVGENKVTFKGEAKYLAEYHWDS
jgi:hypothetical protein